MRVESVVGTGVVIAVLIASQLPASGQPLSASGRQAAGSEAQVPSAGQPAPSGPVLRLTLDEAVAHALEQNLSIQVERVNPQIQDLNILNARTFWTPTISSTLTTFSQDSPSSSFLSGATQRVSDEQFATSLSVNHLLPWGGANYVVNWNGTRATTTNIFSNFNPVLRSNLDVTFTQPLMRNFRIDTARQQLLVSRKNRELSDLQLRQTIIGTVRSVKNAYWELVFANANLDVQRQSLELSRESLRNNRTRVEVGTMAPIDIVEAQAEVARNEEAVILAEASIQSAEDRLRALILDPTTPDYWRLTLQPTDPPSVDTRPVDIDAAVRAALDVRTDLRQARTSLETTDISIRYFRNQRLPDVNVQVNYAAAGLGGTEFVRGEGFPGDIIGQTNRNFGSVLGDVLSNDFPTWSVGVTVGYPIGRSTAEASLARSRLEYQQAQTNIRNLELQVSTQIRELGRQVNTNLKRLDATRASRELAARRLEAEQKKFTVGLATSFLVFQAQRDLAQARNNELRALLDYNRSLVDFEAAQEGAIGGGGIVVASATPAPSGPVSGGGGR